MYQIKNIVFDLGNVLVDLDFGKTEQAFAQIMEQDLVFDSYNQQTTDLFRKFELGEISTQNFLISLQNMVVQPCSFEQLTDAWNGMLLGIRDIRFELLRQLKKKYRLFVLSNTNAIHMDWIFKHIESEHGILDFQSTYFEKIYLSHLIHMRKPDRAIFEFVLEDGKMLAEETLFVDDKAENIEMAKALNWQTLLHNPTSEIVEVLNAYL